MKKKQSVKMTSQSVKFVTSQNVWRRGVRNFTDWLVIFTDCFFFILSIMPVLNTIRKITARVSKTAAFTDRDLNFVTYRVIISILLFNQIENCRTISKFTVGFGKLLRISFKFKLSVDDMSVFSWSLFDGTKNFSGVRKTMALRFMILPTYSFTE